MKDILLAVQWRDNAVELIDQTQLPKKLVYCRCRSVREVWRAIYQLKVRGAPAIGVAAAFGMVVAARACRSRTLSAALRYMQQQGAYLKSSRPTAVNLAWAVQRVYEAIAGAATVSEIVERSLAQAQSIADAEYRSSQQMGRYGAELLRPDSRILTYCNTGMLATAGEGTALSVIYAWSRRKNTQQVYACETRPLLQGARLTAWELTQRNIPVTVICDNMAGYLMQQGKIDAVLIGADRICANGDTANKIGSYTMAVLARSHGIPFYVVAPCSTVDLSLSDGSAIPIEQRPADEVRRLGGVPVTPAQVNVYNPAFDMVPARLISAIVTERGVARAPWRAALRRMCAA